MPQKPNTPNSILASLLVLPDTGYFIRDDGAIVPNGCYVSQLAPGSDNYAAVSYLGKTERLNILVHEQFIGPIPEGWHVDHQCNNIMCGRPEHLMAMTGSENNARSNSWSGINTRKVVCIRGHEFSGGNLYLYTDKANGGKHRYCKACQQIHEGNRGKAAANARHREKYAAEREAAGFAPVRSGPQARCAKDLHDLVGDNRLEYPKEGRATRVLCKACTNAKWEENKDAIKARRKELAALKKAV